MGIILVHLAKSDGMSFSPTICQYVFLLWWGPIKMTAKWFIQVGKSFDLRAPMECHSTCCRKQTSGTTLDNQSRKKKQNTDYALIVLIILMDHDHEPPSK
jgi:hypothetical protein